MKLRFPETEIPAWALKYDYPREETELMNLCPHIQEAGFITKNELRLIANWKSPRSAGHIEKNSEEYIKEITAWSFSATDERSKIEVLTLLNGVKWPSASVILHLFHKNNYPLLDFRALWSVETDVPNQYTFEFWWPYVEYCRGLADKNKISMRTLDRALWQYSKENQNA
jgi:hypothetical protein